MTDDRSIVFTHADLCFRNIMVSKGSWWAAPKVLAVVDWHQSGWYPQDWEWLKAWGMCDYLPDGSRDTTWLDTMLGPPEKDYALAYEYITLTGLV
jgi:hypothetical protein